MAHQQNTDLMDHPKIISRLFFPRRKQAADTPNAVSHFIQLADGISIGCRFYPAGLDGPNILYFHGNGETAPDYDHIAPMYQARGLNLFVADYRGYGMSGGSPTCSGIIRDAHPIFRGFFSFIHGRGQSGSLYVMGRSLGSAPAIEVAYHHQQQLNGLIVESGFASARGQLARLGVTHLFENVKEPVGFGNEVKIKAVLIPVLVIHGEKDAIIPVEEGRTLYALSGAQLKSALFVPDAGHNNLLDHALEAYMEAIAGFTKGK